MPPVDAWLPNGAASLDSVFAMYGPRSEDGMGWDGMGGDVRGGFKVVCYRRGWTRNSSERKGPIRPYVRVKTHE
jgi:hypothetical protein